MYYQLLQLPWICAVTDLIPQVFYTLTTGVLTTYVVLVPRDY